MGKCCTRKYTEHITLTLTYNSTYADFSLFSKLKHETFLSWKRCCCLNMQNLSRPLLYQTRKLPTRLSIFILSYTCIFWSIELRRLLFLTCNTNGFLFFFFFFFYIVLPTSTGLSVVNLEDCIISLHVTNSSNLPFFIVLPCILIPMKFIHQQMHSLLNLIKL